jgi:hypothetical protein
MTTASHPHPPTPRPGTLQFFLFPRLKRNLKRKTFSECRGGEGKNDAGTEGKSSRTVLNNGKSGGINVLILKESILRVIKFWKCSEKYTIYEKNFSFLGPPSSYISCPRYITIL